ncbi:MAG: hypothetical protein HC828_16415 [Blastochloris sp.]|nr:hypothetical protein [Blastochloris sp.]
MVPIVLIQGEPLGDVLVGIRGIPGGEIHDDHADQGAHPGVIFWPDIASLRESKRTMARRLAGEGYAVLVLNPYYRDVSGEQFADFVAFIQNEGFQKVRPWRARLDANAIGRDASAAVAGSINRRRSIGV